jgi:aminoglycoside phosphotransferase family enzyme/predicted kinase
MDSTLPPLVQQMLRPGFYPHPVQEPISLIQTHVSFVFLTGDWVYKLKKPVNFGFLDYSTLERRKEFCDREIELNQRGAAELYAGVVAIAQTGETYQLDETGAEPAVEYAVKMHQFPQDALMSVRFDRGEVTEADIIQLARVVAEFHRTAPTSDYISSFGEIPQIKVSFDENFAQTAGYIGGPQTQDQFDLTRRWTEEFFANNVDLFNGRVAGGFIRNGHGDLHLGNICWLNDRPRLFDCIEFNEPFRFVDTIYDVAFLAMDLEARGRADLANAFVNEYAERSGDWAGLALLRLYLSRQSYVRAKVTSFLLNDPAIPEADRAAAHDRAAAYYRQSASYAQPRSGKLILMCGLSGSGKSTVARQLARQTAGIQIRSDAVRKHLGAVPLDQKGPQSLYSAEMTARTYDRLLQLGLDLASRGETVILDAKYDRSDLRQAAIKGAADRQLEIELVHCTAPIEVLRDRLNQRQGDIADATAELLASQVAAFEAFSPDERARLRTIDTSQASAVADLVTQLL